jgi:hypothetical protein
VTVVAFLIFPTKTNSFNVESLKGHAITKVSNMIRHPIKVPPTEPTDVKIWRMEMGLSECL